MAYSIYDIDSIISALPPEDRARRSGIIERMMVHKAALERTSHLKTKPKPGGGAPDLRFRDPDADFAPPKRDASPRWVKIEERDVGEEHIIDVPEEDITPL